MYMLKCLNNNFHFILLSFCTSQLQVPRQTESHISQANTAKNPKFAIKTKQNIVSVSAQKKIKQKKQKTEKKTLHKTSIQCQ